MFDMLTFALVICGFVMIGGIIGGAFECDGKNFWTGALAGCFIWGFLILWYFAGISVL